MIPYLHYNWKSRQYPSAPSVYIYTSDGIFVDYSNTKEGCIGVVTETISAMKEIMIEVALNVLLAAGAAIGAYEGAMGAFLACDIICIEAHIRWHRLDTALGLT